MKRSAVKVGIKSADEKRWKLTNLYNTMQNYKITAIEYKGRYRQCEAARCQCLVPSASGNAQVAAAAFIVMATTIRKKLQKKLRKPRCAELCLVRCEADSAGIHLTHSSERGTFEHCSKTDKHTAHLTLCDANAS
ncbi:hypothetical protein J6590_041297 [Homalodisca vitripennis]|nr:hypothetical protein J6590_041297 [Homalodisca vitripennis]